MFLSKLLSIFSKKEGKKAFSLILLMTITALVDAAGVASILPFMAVLSNPTTIETNFYLSKLFLFSGLQSDKSFLFFLGIAVFTVMVTALTLKAFTLYLTLRFVRLLEHTLSSKLMDRYLKQPYSWFFTRNSSDLSKSIVSESSQVVGNAVMPIMQMISYGSVVVAMTVLIMIVNFQLALKVGGVLIGVYLLLYFSVNRKLTAIGKNRLNFNEIRFKTLTEAFGGIKEIKVCGFEEIYIKSFKTVSKSFAKIEALAPVIGQLPRYLLEIVAFGSLLIVTLFFLSESNDIQDMLPVLSLFAFAGYRLMPAMQQFYSYSTSLRYAKPAVDAMFDELLVNCKNEYLDNYKPAVNFNKSLTLTNICYSYDESRNTLENINLSIDKNSLVGFVGSTGSGKTTLVDIILRLIDPDSGGFLVDDIPLANTNKKSWQKMIGYVPQSIFLTDNTISKNIAFGCAKEEIDSRQLKKAATIANIHDFIESELMVGYDTIVGERGIRLSGGQRQRLGIARALYRNPELLIFDEATSALDNLTEKRVINSLQNIGKNMTTIMIAHRLSTVKLCDQIHVFDSGKIVSSGTYSYLIGNCPHFKAISLANN